MNLKVGDIITMKKAHPCGGKDFEVLRIGADLKIRCLSCSHEIMAPRSKIEKNIKNIKEQV